MGEPPAKKAKLESRIWLPQSIETIDNKLRFDSTTYHSEIPQAIQESDEPVVLGVDEAGRGPVLGPMVYGISYCLASYQNELKKYGFADSKTLKDEKRQELFKAMENTNEELFKQVGWATTTMTAKDISSGMLQDVMGRGAYNLNEQAHDVTMELIRQTLNKGVKITKLFVDTVGPPATYQAKLRKWFPEIDEITVCKKADSIYPIVSAASVVAKVTRDLNLQWFTANLLHGANLGSGYPSDPNTSKWLNSHVDPVFGWCFGLIRFLWQTAKDSLERNKAVPVIYEAQCVKDSGYHDVSALFASKDEAFLNSYYGSGSVDL